jgi:peptidoglycan/xylan/chitin deacetylase (PgdA/CDA1 family)
MATLGLTAAAAPAHARTVVSLTFDDGQATQYQVRKPLRKHRMRGTFYVNSGSVCTAWCESAWDMSWRQLAALARDGNEIGGHTLDHVDLTRPDIPRSEKRRQVCADRHELAERGFHPVSFAYPYGRHGATAESLVRKCGYTSARGAAKSAVAVESIPPRHPYGMSAEGHSGEIDLGEMQAEVRDAEAVRGGWVQLAFHGICPTRCGDGWVKPRTFRALLDWLVKRRARGTVVQTVRAVIRRT